ncbi:MAG: hypothetical protein F6K09_11890 [Merismopedia sp. SIO2A8]|nr:hypothetical protein [Symploca sp. SIO2B6]NET49398.1 hypothetical protein [Merismopedia sp. SIO2A8]
MRGESALSAGERELITAYVSGLNACNYCYGSHQAIATDLNFERMLVFHHLTLTKLYTTLILQINFYKIGG